MAVSRVFNYNDEAKESVDGFDEDTRWVLFISKALGA